MPDNKLAIQDACILFDLVDLSLLDEFFQLDLEVYTTPQVIGEITDEVQWSKIQPFLESRTLDIDEQGSLELIFELTQKHSGLSFTDCSVLEVATRRSATILSSDGGLRKIAKRKECIVHGTIWIIEQLHEKQFISTAEAIFKLKKYALINKRAPVSHIRVLIQKLKELE